MVDNARAIPLLPETMTALTLNGANAIEKNLEFLILLFTAFDADTYDAIGTLGYLEIDETGTAGGGFLVQNARGIDCLNIIIEGKNLSALQLSGAGWEIERKNNTYISALKTTEDAMDTGGAQTALDTLTFNATAELDATVTLVASYGSKMIFNPLGPVHLRFRDGSTWALIEYKNMTWDMIEGQELTWDELEALRKDKG